MRLKNSALYDYFFIYLAILPKRKYTMYSFKSILTLGLLAVFMMWLSGCSPDKQPKKVKKAKVVRVVKAKQTRLVELLETTGDVVAVNTVTLHATVEGPIKYCPWREGDVIKKAGQKIIEIYRPLYHQQRAVAKAELDVKKAVLEDLKVGPRPEEIAAAKETVIHLESCTKFAKIDLARVSSLATKNVLSKKEQENAHVNYVKCKTQLEGAKDKLAMLEQGTKKTELAIAEAAVYKATASLALAQAQVDECIIKAPFPGIITQVFVRPGDLTHLSSPRMKLVKMMDPKSLIIRAGLPESSAAHLTKGTKVTVRLDAYPGKKFNAEVERIHPRIEWNSRTRIIEARIFEPVKLIPRMFARVSVQGRVVEKAVVVPDSAIIITPRGHHIVFVVKNGKAERRKVKIGLEKGSNVQISDGVRAGELVVIAGNLNLKDGAPVKIVKDTAKITEGEKK
jgi:multidrug efflux pump subunit AcrA (membrane-fusion protein)